MISWHEHDFSLTSTIDVFNHSVSSSMSWLFDSQFNLLHSKTSYQHINFSHFTAIFTLSVIGLLIGLLCRTDVCGIKTKMCRRKKKKMQENIEIAVIGEVQKATWKLCWLLPNMGLLHYPHIHTYPSVLIISQNIMSVKITIKSISIDTLELFADLWALFGF